MANGVSRGPKACRRSCAERSSGGRPINEGGRWSADRDHQERGGCMKNALTSATARFACHAPDNSASRAAQAGDSTARRSGRHNAERDARRGVLSRRSRAGLDFSRADPLGGVRCASRTRCHSATRCDNADGWVAVSGHANSGLGLSIPRTHLIALLQRHSGNARLLVKQSAHDLDQLRGLRWFKLRERNIHRLGTSFRNRSLSQTSLD